MFNDRYGLTDAVIDYIKNNTRRIEGGEQFQRAATSAEDFTYEEATGCIVMCCQGIASPESSASSCRAFRTMTVFARALSNRGTNPQIPPRMGLSTRKREQPLNLTLPARPSPH